MSTLQRPASRPVPPAQRDGPGARAAAQAQATRPDRVEIIQPDQYADRRAEPRFACDDRGALLLLSSGQVVRCRILDQSASGARVAFDRIDGVPGELWLIDIDENTVRHGASAWSTMNRMGLKFDLVLKLAPGEPRPARVPEVVFNAWLLLTGREPPKPADDDVLYFD